MFAKDHHGLLVRELIKIGVSKETAEKFADEWKNKVYEHDLEMEKLRDQYLDPWGR